MNSIEIGVKELRLKGEEQGVEFAGSEMFPHFSLGTRQLNLNKPSTGVSFLAQILPCPPSSCVIICHVS